jgi:hypothetical protein
MTGRDSENGRSLAAELDEVQTRSEVRNFGKTDKIGAQSNIRQLRWYLLGSVGFVMNVNKTKSTPELQDRLFQRYEATLEDFATSYVTNMMDPAGGGKDAIWLDGKDAKWLAARLARKNNAPDKSGKEKAEMPEYLWKQYTDLRRELDTVAEPAWNVVTQNNTPAMIILSGSDIFRTHDRWLQQWWESERKIGDAELADQKSKNAQEWCKVRPADPDAAICDLHGTTCKHGKFPPSWTLPSSYFTAVRMGPIADYMADAFAKFKQPMDGMYPPFKTDPDYKHMFSSTSRSGPPPNAADGGAQLEVARGSSLSRSSLSAKDDDMYEAENGDWKGQALAYQAVAAAADRHGKVAANTSVLQVQTTQVEQMEHTGSVISMFSGLVSFICEALTNRESAAHEVGLCSWDENPFVGGL